MARSSNTSKRKIFYRDCVEDDDLWLTCPYCECTFFYLDAHLDHIESVYSGGTGNKNNLLPICKDCNLSKSNKVLHGWLISQSISPEAVYHRLKKLNKKIPYLMLEYLKYSE